MSWSHNCCGRGGGWGGGRGVEGHGRQACVRACVREQAKKLTCSGCCTRRCQAAPASAPPCRWAHQTRLPRSRLRGRQAVATRRRSAGAAPNPRLPRPLPPPPQARAHPPELGGAAGARGLQRRDSQGSRACAPRPPHLAPTFVERTSTCCGLLQRRCESTEWRGAAPPSPRVVQTWQHRAIRAAGRGNGGLLGALAARGESGAAVQRERSSLLAPTRGRS